MDEYLRLGPGTDLMGAQEQLGLLPKKAPLPVVATERSEAAVAHQNAAAMQELEKMMGGVR